MTDQSHIGDAAFYALNIIESVFRGAAAHADLRWYCRVSTYRPGC